MCELRNCSAAPFVYAYSANGRTALCAKCLGMFDANSFNDVIPITSKLQILAKADSLNLLVDASDVTWDAYDGWLILGVPVTKWISGAIDGRCVIPFSE